MANDILKLLIVAVIVAVCSGEMLTCMNCTYMTFSDGDQGTVAALNAWAAGWNDDKCKLNGPFNSTYKGPSGTCQIEKTDGARCGKGFLNVTYKPFGNDVKLVMWVRECLTDDLTAGCTHDLSVINRANHFPSARTDGTQKTTYCTCNDKDKCNHGNQLRWSGIVLILPLLGVALFSWK